MSVADWFRYAAITFGMVVIAIVLSGALAHCLLRRKLRKRLPMAWQDPWCAPYRRRCWWARLKAWFRGWLPW